MINFALILKLTANCWHCFDSDCLKGAQGTGVDDKDTIRSQTLGLYIYIYIYI